MFFSQVLVDVHVDPNLLIAYGKTFWIPITVSYFHTLEFFLFLPNFL